MNYLRFKNVNLLNQFETAKVRTQKNSFSLKHDTPDYQSITQVYPKT